ncbi:hypothetical protein [Spirosoma areae]
MATFFPYNLDGTSFIAEQRFIVNSAIFPDPRVIIAIFSYQFDSDKHLRGYYKADAANNATARNGASYTYTGENITKANSFSGRDRGPDGFYEYDDKINPFFGLLDDPNVDPQLRCNRNNIIKSYAPGFPNSDRSYQYEYNPQGLPTKRTTVGTNEVVTYTYKSY